MVNIHKEIQLVKVGSLKPYKQNAKKHPQEQVEKLALHIEGCGWDQPIVVDEDNIILKGHGRLAAAKHLKLKEVPVIVASGLTEAQKKAVRIADNKLAESEWDNDILKGELEGLDLAGWDVGELGFGEEEIGSLLGTGPSDSGGNDGLTDPDEVPDVDQNVFGVKRGQIWQLGKHRVMCGDSTSEADVARLMGGVKADMVFTDPPYGVSYVGRKGSMYFHGNRPGKNDWNSIKNDDISGDELSDLFEKSTTLSCVFSKDNAALYLFFAINKSKECIPIFDSVGLTIRNWLVWDKGNVGYHAMGAQYKPNYEAFLYMVKKKSPPWHGGDKQQTLWRYPRESTGTHPTSKPTLLIQNAIDNHRPESVLDLFLGSGSTLIACEKTGRTCYGMELDEHYCSVIIKRWQDFTGETADLIENPE